MRPRICASTFVFLFRVNAAKPDLVLKWWSGAVGFIARNLGVFGEQGIGSLQAELPPPLSPSAQVARSPRDRPYRFGSVIPTTNPNRGA